MVRVTRNDFASIANDIRGGVGLDGCATLTNQEFARLFFKNNYSFGVKILSLYMVRLATLADCNSVLMSESFMVAPTGAISASQVLTLPTTMALRSVKIA